MRNAVCSDTKCEMLVELAEHSCVFAFHIHFEFFLNIVVLQV
jgi:hypothetical protein